MSNLFKRLEQAHNGHNGIVLPDGTPATVEPQPDPVHIACLQIIHGLAHLPELAEVTAQLLDQKTEMAEAGELVTVGQETTIRSVAACAKFQVDAKQLVEWSVKASEEVDGE